MNLKVFILLLLVTGCIKNVDKDAFSMSLQGEQESIQDLCHELNQIGTLQEHFKLIKINSERTFQLFEQDKITIDQDYFNYLQDQINFHVQKVRLLLDERFTESLYPYEVRWRIDRDDLKNFVGRFLPGGFSIRDVRFLGAVYWGEERHDYLDFITYQFTAKSIDVVFQSKGSALEICQLQQTRIFLMEMEYKHLNRTKYRLYNLISRSSHEN